MGISKSQTQTSMIHTRAGNMYEVINSIEEIERFVSDDFINDNTFIKFKFPDNQELYLRKIDIESFYESD